ncbi:MAG: hypothetical protein IJU71_00860, partial [Selenomonadaceae bacterium]|nr:hypothetical protein [Selenomonadaceae bacterium]
MNDENNVIGISAASDENVSVIAKAYEDFFRQWQATPTDDQLKVAVIEGLSDLNKLYRAECTSFVEETLMPLLKASFKESIAPTEQAYSMSFDFDEPYIKTCFAELQTRFIKSMVDSQTRALKAVKAKCDERGMKTSEIVKVFRLVLGLNSREVLENLKFQQTVLKVWYPPNFPFLIARQKAPRKASEDGASDDSYDALV